MKTGLVATSLLALTLLLACSPHPTAGEVVDRTAPVACEKAKQCNGDAKFELAYPGGATDCVNRVKSESEKKLGSDLSKSSVCTDEEVDKCLEDLKNATCPEQKATELVLPAAPCNC